MVDDSLFLRTLNTAVHAGVPCASKETQRLEWVIMWRSILWKDSYWLP